MLKIRDTKVGETVAITLLVKTAEIKYTRPPGNKPYLYTVVTDGTDELAGQDWDYGNNPPPAPNSVWLFTGTIGEYMGKKQIKISNMSPSDVGVEKFAPSGDVNVAEYIEMVKLLIAGITNEPAKDLVRQVFNDNMHALKTLPAAKGMHHAFVSGLLKHTVDVTRKAKAIAEMTPMANVDLVVAGGLLHDMGKFWTYVLNGAIIDMTDEGQLLEHIMLGAMQLNKYRTPQNSDVMDLILHIISSHHGQLEWGSPTTPRFIEAIIVHFADNVDAKCQSVIEVNYRTPVDAKWTEKIWVMDNKPMMSQLYVSEIMNN